MMSFDLKSMLCGSSMVLLLAAIGCDSDVETSADAAVREDDDNSASGGSSGSSDDTKGAAASGDETDSSEDDKQHAAAGDDAPGDDKPAEDKKDAAASSNDDKPGSTAPTARGPYATATIASAGEEALGYISFFDKLEGQTVDFERAREFSGQADLWVVGNTAFIADDETLEVSRFEVKNKKLADRADGKLNFSATGQSSVGFWKNKFVSAERAYYFNEPSEIVVWNPSTLEIEGTIALPELPERNGLTPYPAYSDRATVLRGNKLYWPVYYTSEADDFFKYDGKSELLVIDTERNEVLEKLELPCPGIDFASEDEAGNAYFSSWVFAPPATAVFDQPPTCVAKLPAGDHPRLETAFTVSDLTDGREGGALRYVGNGQAILSVFHLEHAPEADRTDIQTVAYGANWRFWSVDLSTTKATEITEIDWNAGAAYGSNIEGESYILIPDGSYSNTSVHRLVLDGEVAKIEQDAVLKTKGWSMRLFRLAE
jgi:hypothetical protein